MNSSLPFFSIVTPSFNQAAYVKKCLESIGRQRFRDFEHIILDGCSTDGTVDLLQSYAAAHDNVMLIVEKDNGQVDAINRGFHEAKGEYLIWLNTDDYLIDESVLAEVYQQLQTNPVDFLYGRGEFVDANGTYIKDVYINNDPSQLRNRLMVSVGILQPATFIAKQAFQDLGDLLEQHPYCFDYEYWMRAVRHNKTFRHLPNNITRATLHSDSKTVGARVNSLRDTCEVNKSHYGFTSLEWIKKLVECELTGADGIIDSKQAGSKAVKEQVNRKFMAMNNNKKSIAAILSRAHIPEAAASLATLKTELSLGSHNTVVTAFDGSFFTSGLTLISGLHKLDTDFMICVYDIGLSREQRDLLNTLNHVYVLDFDRQAHKYCPDYFTPATYGFKSYAMWHPSNFLDNSDRLLWLDAGICPIRPLTKTLAVIEEHDIFLVDHNDKGIWPVRNITFTSDKCIHAIEATAEELSADHLRAGACGYKIGGTFQQLFDTAFKISLNADALCGDKHPKPPVYMTRSGGSEAERRKAKEDQNWLYQQPTQTLRKLYGYFGHRHDQSILSILAARNKAPFHSATDYCIADDASSAASKTRWSTGKETPASDQISNYYLDSPAELMQHRGLFRNTEHLRFERTHHADAAIIMGNGPSLRDFDFARLKNFDVFGMNAAYRYWQQINWYPQYYSCLDLVVGLSHKVEIAELINNSEKYGIRLFLLRQNLIDELGAIGRSERVVNFDELVHHVSLLQSPTITTGSHTAAWSALLGYEHIYLLGIDCNYVEHVDGSRETGRGTELEIVDTKDNPNYFFDGYQQKGDLYNIPNPDRDIHMSSWREVSQLVRESGHEILNANLQSKVDSIDFCDFETIEKGEAPVVIPRSTILGTKTSGDTVKRSNARLPNSTTRENGKQAEIQPQKILPTTNTPMTEKLNLTNNDTSPDTQNSLIAALKRRISGLASAGYRHLTRYGIFALPYLLLITFLAYRVLLSEGNEQLYLLGTLLLSVFVGVGLVGAEAARRMKLHMQALEDRTDAPRRTIERLRNDVASLLRTKLTDVERQELNSLLDLSSGISDPQQISREVDQLKNNVEKLSTQLSSKAPKQSIENLRELISRVDKDLEPLAFELSELSVSLEAYREKADQISGVDIARISADLDNLVARISATVTTDQLDYRLEQTVPLSAIENLESLENQVREFQQQNASFNDVADDLTEQIAQLRKIDSKLDALPQKNLADYNVFNRALRKEQVDHLLEHWSRPLGINPPERSLYYMAHRFVALEDRLRGRLATNIETAVLRALALESIQEKNIQILEIGTLFGIGAAMLYDHVCDRFDNISITLLDPLDGYYGQSRDILSGIAINEKTLLENLAHVGIDRKNVQLIKHFSHEDAAIEAASKSSYDYILVDGDHTRTGIEIDFKNYAHLLKKGGLILFDDYGSDDWPDVAAFVDEVVAKDERFGFVGSGWRTAIYRRVM